MKKLVPGALPSFVAILAFFLPFAESSARAEPLVIVAGERLEVFFKGIPAGDVATHNGPYRVDDQGYVEMPFLKSRILAKGKTVSELEKAIAGLYKKTGIYPQISLTIQKDGDEPEPLITVDGKRAGNSGQFKYIRDMKLADAVALAKPTKFFRGTVRIIRGDKTWNYNINDAKSKAIRLLPKDIIELVK